MPIGTSDGEYHEDEMAYQRSQFQVADTGGNSVPPIEIENALTLHAIGRATPSQVRGMIPPGWSVNFQRSNDAYRVYGPDGKEHFIWP